MQKDSLRFAHPHLHSTPPRHACSVLAAFYREAVRRVEYEERLAAIEKAAQVTRSARQEREAVG